MQSKRWTGGLPPRCVADCRWTRHLGACSTLLRQPAPTDRLPPTFDGFEAIRYYALASGYGLPDLTDAYRIETPDQYEAQADGTVVYNYLAVSGGGSAGAFGAGILNGWTASGDRPKFKVVTGVSTGALISTFAFLGPDYDDELKGSIYHRRCFAHLCQARRGSCQP